MFIRLLLATIASIAAPLAAVAQSTTDLQGMWSLVSSVMDKDGKAVDQFGPGAKGMMMSGADGPFMLTIIGPNLPKFASNSRASGTADENKAVVAGSIANVWYVRSRRRLQYPNPENRLCDLSQLGRDRAKAHFALVRLQ
jgi:hypothetical protein